MHNFDFLFHILNKKRLQKNKTKIVEFFTKGGGSAMGIFSTKKKRKKKKCKDDQNGLIHPEN